MKNSEKLRNEASVMLAGAFEKLYHLQEFDFAETADKITQKMMEASEAYVWEMHKSISIL